MAAVRTTTRRNSWSGGGGGWSFSAEVLDQKGVLATHSLFVTVCHSQLAKYRGQTCAIWKARLARKLHSAINTDVFPVINVE